MQRLRRARMMNSVFPDGLEAWSRLADEGRFSDARQLSQKIIDLVRDRLRDPGGSSTERNQALVVGILFRGLQNLEDLIITTTEAWASVPDQVERAWQQMCDARDRLRFARRFLM